MCVFVFFFFKALVNAARAVERSQTSSPRPSKTSKIAPGVKCASGLGQARLVAVRALEGHFTSL